MGTEKELDRDYGQIGYQLGFSDDKENKAMLEKRLDQNQRELQEKAEALKRDSLTTLETIQNTAANLNSELLKVEQLLDTTEKAYVSQADNLLITHSVSWINDKEGAISFHFLPSILFVVVGSMAMSTAVLIPDYFATSFLDLNTQPWQITIILKVLIFSGIGTLMYLTLVKFIASKKYKGKPMPYYFIFILLTVVAWIISVSLNLQIVANSLLLLLGLNAVTLLPMGLSMLSFYYNRTKHLRVARNGIRRHLTKIRQIALAFEKNNAIKSFEETINEHAAYLKQKESITLGFLHGKADKNKQDRLNAQKASQKEKYEGLKKRYKL